MNKQTRDLPEHVKDGDEFPGPEKPVQIGLIGRIYRGHWYHWCSPRSKGDWCWWIIGREVTEEELAKYGRWL